MPYDQIGRQRAARGDEPRLMDPVTPPARSRWSLCAEAGQLSPFGVADRHLSEIGLLCAAASKHSPRIVDKRPRKVSRRSPPY